MSTPLFSRDTVSGTDSLPRQRALRSAGTPSARFGPAGEASAQAAARCRQAWVDRARHLTSQDPCTALGLGPAATVLVVAAHDDDPDVALGRSLRALRTAGVGIATLEVGTDPVLTEALRAHDGEALVTRLGAHLTDTAAGTPAAVLTVWEHDPEPDHRTVGRATRWAARQADLPVYGYPVWAFHRSDPAAVLPADGGRVLRLDGAEAAPSELPELPELLISM